MTQDLQQLLEKIQRDGVEKAQGEADSIVANAHSQAKAIVEQARTAAETLKSEAQESAQAFERRADETIRQAARDAVLHVEKAVTRLFEQLLLKGVNESFRTNQQLVGELAEAAVRAYMTDDSSVEVVGAAPLADYLRANLAAAAKDGVTVVTDETTGSGFEVRLAEGRIVHSFSGQAVSEALAQQLRPRLAKLMRE